MEDITLDVCRIEGLCAKQQVGTFKGFIKQFIARGNKTAEVQLLRQAGKDK